MPLKQEENKKLTDYLRQIHGDVAEYEKDPNPAPGVSRSIRSKTIVPKGGEIDKELKSESEMKEAGSNNDGNGAMMMASGGLVDDMQFTLPKDTSTLSGLTSMTSAVDSPTPPQISTPPEKDVSTQDNEKIADSTPGHTADDLSQYVKGQEAQASKYGPEQEQAVLDSILKERGGIGRNIGRGVAAFTDTAGPAFGAGTGTLRSLDERENEMDKARLESVPTLQGMNEKQMAQKQALEGMTSGTPLGASQVAPLAAFFERMGVPKSEIPKLLQNPAAARQVLEPFATVMSKDEQIKMETLLKQLELAQHGQMMQNEATKTLAGQGPIAALANKLLHPGVNEKLEQEAGIGNQPNQFNHAGIPSGSTYRAPDGTLRRKR